MKRLLSILLSLVLSLTLVGCGGGAAPSQQQQQSTQQTTSEQKTTGALAASEQPKFGGVYLDVTIDEFNAMGFEYGDSCDVTFSNGYKLEDIPYYNGFYSKTGHPLICAYPGFPHIDIAFNNGDPLWKVAGLKEGDTGTVTLREKGKYLTTQNALAAVYTSNRDDYPSDVAFANFRAMKGGRRAPYTAPPRRATTSTAVRLMPARLRRRPAFSSSSTRRTPRRRSRATMPTPPSTWRGTRVSTMPATSPHWT